MKDGHFSDSLPTQVLLVLDSPERTNLEYHFIHLTRGFNHFMTQLTEKRDKTLPPKKTQSLGSSDARHPRVHKVTRHPVAWYRPQTKVWMKPELASLFSVAMTTAAVSNASLRMKKRARRTCGQGLHPLGEFTAPTWQPRMYIINLFKWEPKRLIRQSSSILLPFACPLIYFHPCPVWPFHSGLLDEAQGVLLLLAGVEAGWAGCSLNATLLGPPPLPPLPPCLSLRDDCWFTLACWQLSEEILLPVHLFSSDIT